MSSALPFDAFTLSIDGTNLIEASAGTGKTYGIAALFTRLIVLEKKDIEKILVVTFTKAATAELKTRLRARLDEVLQVLNEIQTLGGKPEHISDGLNKYYEKEKKSPDDFLNRLIPLALGEQDGQESCHRLILRLKAALSQFDNASIYTIHGFCQRVLRDYAFLCGAPLDVELSDDSRERLLIPAQDFWRQKVATDATLAQLVFDRKCTPEEMLAEIKSYTGRPYLKFRRPEGDLQEAQAKLQETWEKICGQLEDLEKAFWAIFPKLNGQTYKRKTFENVFTDLKTNAESNRLPRLSKQTLEKLSLFNIDTLNSKLKKEYKANADAPEIIQLQALANLGRDLQAMKSAEEAVFICLQLDLLSYINQSIAEQKKSRRERVFDDLLLDVHQALTTNEHGNALAKAAAANWEIALIDEFQDTDPLQYEIFRQIFIEQGCPLFLVGDPKQAIYSFRGADIYAYLQAAQDADRHYTLAVNYRSHAKLINGISALFKQKKHPFVLENIDYSDVSASRAESRLSPHRPAIQVRWLNTDDQTGKEILRSRAAEYCADEIAFALNEAAEGRLNFKGRALESGDIAVLVRTNNEAAMIAGKLKQRRIQSVLLSRQSVFDSAEADSLSALIGFWLNPRQTDWLRFVLTGVLFGYTAKEIYELNHNEHQLLKWLESSAEAMEKWRKGGIFAAVQQFAARHDIETRLLKGGNERSLTNYYQILELLAEEDSQSRNPAALHKWLNEQISRARSGHFPSDAQTIRLESDEKLVKIVTMHASKGLQYPLVYCPFAWDTKDNSKENWKILHTENHETELLAKSQTSEAELSHLADEKTAEDLRLLYVALTRAEEQLNIYAAANKNCTPNNPFAYLLEGLPEAGRESVSQSYQSTTDVVEMLKTNWQRFIKNAPENTEFTFTEEAPPETVYQYSHQQDQALSAHSIKRRNFDFIRHTSFTGLSRHTKSTDEQHEPLQPAIDPAESADRAMPSENLPSPLSDGLDIHHFPRGTNAGVCLHEMLEKLDFAASAESQSEMIAEVLQRHSFEDKWLPTVSTMLDTCRLTPLIGESLSQIPPTRRLPEMGFTLYMDDFKLDDLRRWFASSEANLPPECVQAAQLLDFHDLQGYLNGFIDMVCQDSDGHVVLIDYKSNHLGNDASAYTQQAMNEAVAHHHYYLQALIYAVAIARYYALRGKPLPKIAIRYLFLRGMDGSDQGIWKWDIDTALLSTFVERKTNS